MHVSCESGYETECKKDYDIYTCIGDKGAPANKIVLKECTSQLNYQTSIRTLNQLVLMQN